MEKLLALKRERAGCIEEMHSLVMKSEEAGVELAGDPLKRWEELHNKVMSLDSRIKIVEQTESLKKDIDTIDSPAKRPNPNDRALGDSGFKSVGEFLYTAVYKPNDPRIQAALDMNVGESGGIMVPPEMRDTILSVTPQDAVIRPRATVLEAGDQPDAKVEIPALNQSAAQNMYAGVEVKWTKSGTTKPETDAKLRSIALQPQEIAGYIEVTDQLLRNWSGLGSLLETLFRGANIAAQDTAFLSGDGVGKPKGILNAAATIKVNRAQADKVAYADLTSMYSQARFSAALLWVINQSVLPELLALESTLGQLIWQPSVREGVPGTIFGVPVIFNERSPQLGDLGDILLADFSYYLIKDGAGPFIASSEHVKFKENITVIKFFTNVDGQAWLTEPITQEGGYQVSPFVALDVPA